MSGFISRFAFFIDFPPQFYRVLFEAEVMELALVVFSLLATFVAAALTVPAGFGAIVTSINAIDGEIDADIDLAYDDDADQLESARNSWDAANSGWGMMPVMWGLGMILVGLTAFMMKRPEGIEYVWSLLMPVGLGFTLAPVLNDPAYFDVIFPITMLTHIVIGGLMISGKLTAPGAVEEGA